MSRPRLAPVLTRLPVRGLGGHELASQPVHLARLVERLAGRRPVHPSLRPLARLVRLGERLLPGPVELHDPRAVRVAATAERHHFGLLLAPAREGVGPFAGAAQLERLLAEADHAAVDDAGEHRRELAAGGGEHGLVEERETLRDPPQPDQNAALLVYGEAEQVLVVEALADLGRGRCDLVRGLVVAGRLVLQRERQQEVAALCAVAPFTLDEALRPREPAGGPAHLALHGEVHPERKRAADSPQRVSGLEVCVVRALERAQELVHAPDHVERRGEKLEIVGAEGSRLVGPRKAVARSRPGAGGVGGTTAFEVIVVHVTQRTRRRRAGGRGAESARR